MHIKVPRYTLDKYEMDYFGAPLQNVDTRYSQMDGIMI